MAATERIDLNGTVEGASPEALIANLAAAATANGLKASAPVAGTLILQRRYVTSGVRFFAFAMIVCGIILGSLGLGYAIWAVVGVGVLMLIFARATETVSLVVTGEAGGSRVAAQGAATGPLEEFVSGIFAGR